MNINKNNLKVFAVLLFVYVMLFEFILPVNKFLPKPTVLYESLIHVWKDYSLFTGIMITAGTVYLAIAASIILLWLFRKPLIKLFTSSSAGLDFLQILRAIPIFALIMLAAFWFNTSQTLKIVFAFSMSFISLARVLAKESKIIKAEYVLTALNLNPQKLFTDIYWKNSLPVLFELAIRFQKILWLTVLAYEFISMSFGIGTISRLALKYSDLGALVIIAIVQAILIWIGTTVLRFTKNKIAFWES